MTQITNLNRFRKQKARDEARREALTLKPDLAILSLSATTGEGFTAWLDYLHGLLPR